MEIKFSIAVQNLVAVENLISGQPIPYSEERNPMFPLKVKMIIDPSKEGINITSESGVTGPKYYIQIQFKT